MDKFALFMTAAHAALATLLNSSGIDAGTKEAHLSALETAANTAKDAVTQVVENPTLQADATDLLHDAENVLDQVGEPVVDAAVSSVAGPMGPLAVAATNHLLRYFEGNIDKALDHLFRIKVALVPQS